MSRLLKALGPGLLAFISYIVFSGSVSLYDIVTGVAVAVLAGIITANLLVYDYRKLYNPLRLFWLLAYAAYYLTVAEIKAHVDVARRILHPKLPVNPAIVRVPFEVDSDYSIVTIANSITNTPGTVTVDLNTGKKVLYVHWIDASKGLAPEVTRESISRTFEFFAKKIFE